MIIHCKKCNKAISIPDDRKAPYDAVMQRLCYDCARTLKKKRKKGFIDSFLDSLDLFSRGGKTKKR